MKMVLISRQGLEAAAVRFMTIQVFEGLRDGHQGVQMGDYSKLGSNKKWNQPKKMKYLIFSLWHVEELYFHGSMDQSEIIGQGKIKSSYIEYLMF